VAPITIFCFFGGGGGFINFPENWFVVQGLEPLKPHKRRFFGCWRQKRSSSSSSSFILLACEQREEGRPGLQELFCRSADEKQSAKKRLLPAIM
jgi:hypothetical protein